MQAVFQMSEEHDKKVNAPAAILGGMRPGFLREPGPWESSPAGAGFVGTGFGEQASEKPGKRMRRVL